MGKAAGPPMSGHIRTERLRAEGFAGWGAFTDSRAAALDSRTGAIFERGAG